MGKSCDFSLDNFITIIVLVSAVDVYVFDNDDNKDQKDHNRIVRLMIIMMAKGLSVFCQKRKCTNYYLCQIPQLNILSTGKWKKSRKDSSLLLARRRTSQIEWERNSDDNNNNSIQHYSLLHQPQFITKVRNFSTANWIRKRKITEVMSEVSQRRGKMSWKRTIMNEIKNLAIVREKEEAFEGLNCV